MAFRRPGLKITDAILSDLPVLTGTIRRCRPARSAPKTASSGARDAPDARAGLSNGLSWARSGELRETTVAYLGISGWKLIGSIFVAYTIFVNDVISELRDSKFRPEQAIATFDISVVDQNERTSSAARKRFCFRKN
jgi:hypothetical protein